MLPVLQLQCSNYNFKSKLWVLEADDSMHLFFTICLEFFDFYVSFTGVCICRCNLAQDSLEKEVLNLSGIFLVK